MSDEERFAPPLEGHVLSLWDVGELDLNLGQCQHVGGGGHGVDKVADDVLGAVRAGDAQAAGHALGKGLSGGGGVRVARGGLLGGVTTVEGEVRDLHIRVAASGLIHS